MQEGEPQNPEPASAFNPIFGKLVGTEEGVPADLQGFVAYGLYKVAKREWATEIATRHGRKPSEAELEAYMRTWTSSQITTLRERAAQVLSEYADAVIREEEPRILKNALRGSFWRGVWPSMLASFLYTLVLIGAALVLARSGIDLIGIFRDVTGR
jgi:hypothetical protein